MDTIFANRITDVPRSFLREILKAATEPGTISFAGGLPSRELFPIEAIRNATNKVLDTAGADALQYANSEGFEGLREWIARRYHKKQGLTINPNHILITSGSQQGLDLIGKTLLNDGDDVIIEEPGYLGAIQAFSLYQANFHPVPLHTNGIDITQFAKALNTHDPKIFYAVPNFQNPSGLTYDETNRQQIADLIRDTRTFLIEDDPYGDLRFMGEPKPSFKTLIPDNTIQLGTFSKTVVPSLRIGWIVAPEYIYEKLLIAKQASDLHTNALGQRIDHQFLLDNDLDAHIKKICQTYSIRRDAMISAIHDHFPNDIQCTEPEGGMFVWVTLPEDISSMTLFEKAIQQSVAFVPGHPFYINAKSTNTLRLNFSCMDVETIEIGVKRLANALNKQHA